MKTDLRAQFLLDGNSPKFKFHNDVNHYQIRIFIENAPEDTYAVTYQLHESYYDPVRESKNRSDFSSSITSYGDYIVTAKIRKRSEVDILTKKLSRALKDSYPEPNESIKEAIRNIEKY